MTTQTDIVRYDDRMPRMFFLAAIVWAVVGMLVGVLVAAMLFMPSLNFAPYITFGRLRPLHTKPTPCCPWRRQSCTVTRYVN